MMMNTGSKGVQGAYLGGGQPGANAPMMFNPSLYNPAPDPPFQQPPPPQQQQQQQQQEDQQRPPTMGYQEEPQHQQEQIQQQQEQQQQQQYQNWEGYSQYDQYYQYYNNQGGAQWNGGENANTNDYQNYYYGQDQQQQMYTYDQHQQHQEQQQQPPQQQQHQLQEHPQPLTNGSSGGHPPELVPEASEQEVVANNAASSSRPPSVVAQENVNPHDQNHNMYYDHELQQWVNPADQAGQRFNSGPDLIPNHDGEAGPEESIQEEIVPASNPDPSSEEPSPMHQMHLQGSHAEHYAFYHQQFEQQSRPDILRDDLNNAPNAGSSSIPDQEREPVDGGNDTQSVDDLPMDRLVLGESEPHPIAPPPRIITGSDISAPPPPMASVASNVEVRSEAAGSEINYSQAAIQQPPPPPMMVPPPPTSMTSGERSQAIGSEVNQPLTMQPAPPPAMIRPPSANSAERSEAVGSEINSIPVSGPSSLSSPPFAPPSNMSMLPSVQDARSETIGAADQNYMQVQSSDNQLQRSEAAGSERVAPPPPPSSSMNPASYFMPSQSFPAPDMSTTPINVTERSEAAGSDRREEVSAPLQPPPMAPPTVNSPPPASSIGGSGISLMNNATDIVSSPINVTERSEAAGSDMRDVSAPPPQTIPPPPTGGMVPPQGRNVPVTSPPSIASVPPIVVNNPYVPSITPTAASEERSEAAGSDRREVAAPPPTVAPPTSAGLVPQQRARNVTGSDDRPQRGKTHRKLEESEEDSILSRESDKRRRQQQHRRSPNLDHRKKDRRHRKHHSPYESRDTDRGRSSSYSDDDSSYYRPRRKADYRDFKSSRHNRTSKKSYANHSTHHNNTRDYYGHGRDERRYDRGPSYGYDDRRPSRPTSRGPGANEGMNYSLNHSHSFSNYPYHPYPYAPASYAPAAAAPPVAATPDAKTLETFRQNWEFYNRDPQRLAQLLINDPAKHATLIRYYTMYGHLLPTEPARPPSRVNNTSGVPNISEIRHPPDQSQNNLRITPVVSPEKDLTPSTYPPKSEETPEVEASYSNTTIPEVIPEPLKFSTPHVNGIFSSNGRFLKVPAKSPLLDGRRATLEFHSLKSLMSKQPEFKELQTFPGPLVPGMTHKKEVIQFCQSKIQQIHKYGENIPDKESFVLLWEYLILLLKQKNTLDGSDIAELLLKDRDVHRPYRNQNNQNVNNNNGDVKVKEEIKKDVIEESDHSYTSDNEQNGKEDEQPIALSEDTIEDHTAKFRDYLLFGHQKEGLEYAMSHGLWGHALFLASKMDDERSYSQVMLRFANGLMVNDPLQTLYQYMTGRQPNAVKECADANWGDWRPHLAMILSNAGAKKSNELDKRSILTLGETLTEKGYIWAGQFCSLMANIPFGNYHQKHIKMVLIGGDRTLPFEQFAINEAIHMTEIFEYAQKLSNPDFVQPSFLYYKFLYAVRLLDFGFSSQALHYLEELAKAVTKHPYELDPDLAQVIYQAYSIADRLKYLDPMYTTREGEMSEMGDPEWLVQFKSSLDNQLFSSGQANQVQQQQQQQEVSQQHEQQQQQQQEQQIYEDGEGRRYFFDVNSNQWCLIQEDFGTSSENATQPPPPAPTAENKEEIDEPITMSTPSTAPPTPSMNAAVPPSYPPPTTTTVPPESYTPDQYPSRRESETSTNQPPPSIPMMIPTASSTTSAGPPPPMSMGGGPPPPLSMPPLTQNPMGHMPTPSPPPMSQTSEQHNNYFNDIKKSEQNNVTKPPAPAAAPKKEPAKEPEKPQEKSKGWLSRWFTPKNSAHLPDDKEPSIVWDEEKKKWVDKNAPEDDESNANSAPPSDMDLSRNSSTANFENGAPPPSFGPPGMGGGSSLAPPPPGGNKYLGGLSKKRNRGFVDVFKNSQSSPSLSNNNAPPPSELFMPPPMAAPMNPPIMDESNPPTMGETNPTGSDANGMTTGNGNNPTQTSSSDAPPTFFNPNSYSVAAPTTRRNKY